MLKKILKRTLAVALTVATVVTASVPVSAATLKPKKSHSKAEITEYVNYFNKITEPYTSRPAPESHIPGIDGDGTPRNSYNYDAYKMTVLLQNTKGITAEQKADMKKASRLWQKAWVSEQMMNYYWRTWSDYMYCYIDEYCNIKSSKNSASSFKARAKKTYNKVNTYISKKAKYNKKLAGELKKFNKIRFNAWNKDIDKWFKMSKKQRDKYIIIVSSEGSEAVFTDFVGSMDSAMSKAEMAENPIYSPDFGHADMYPDKNHYETKTLGLWGYDLSEYSPSRELCKHTRWTKW